MATADFSTAVAVNLLKSFFFVIEWSFETFERQYLEKVDSLPFVAMMFAVLLVSEYPELEETVQEMLAVGDPEDSNGGAMQSDSSPS